MLVSSRTSLLLLVELVVQEEVLVVLGEPALVGVGSTVVGGAGELRRHRAPVNVCDGEGILVVLEGDLLSLVRGVGSVVDHDLGIVNVAVIINAASILGTQRVGDVNHPETTAALEAALGTDGSDEVGLLVGDQVVAAAEAGEVGSEVVAEAEGGRVLGVGLLELGEVEDLETVVRGLRANVGVVADDLDVAPRGGDGLSGETADVRQAAVRLDLDEGSTVRLAEESELAARRGGPTPDIVTLASAGADVLVAQEALEVDVVALVLTSVAIDTSLSAGRGITINVVHASGPVLLELGLLALAQGGHGDSIGGRGGLQGVGFEV